MKFFDIRFCVIAVAALLLMVPEARADKESLAKAKELFTRGEVQYRLGYFKIALGYYQAALQQAQRPSIIFNIAQCHRQLNDPDKAVFNYKLYLADWARRHQGKSPPNKAEVEGYIKDLSAVIQKRKQAEALEQAKLSKQEEQRKQEEARKQEELRKQEEARKQEELKRQQEEAARKAAERQKPAQTATKPPPKEKAKEDQDKKPGRLRFLGLPLGARVRVDNTPLSSTLSLQAVTMHPGEHEVVVDAPGYKRFTQRVKLQPGQELKVRVQMEEAPGKQAFWLPISLISLALVGGAEAMAIVFTTKANEYYEQTSDFEENKEMAVIGHSLAGAFGAIAITSFILYMVKGRGEEPTDTSTAAILPLKGGAVFTGSIRF